MIAGAPTTYGHIILDEKGVAWIDDTNTKVVLLTEEMNAFGWSPEELAYQHPHLTLAQVYSALAYYWDHQEDIEAEMRHGDALVEEIQRDIGVRPLIEKLRARGQF